MLRTSLCDYSDVYILVKGTITVANTAAAGAAANNSNKKVIFKNRAPFTSCIKRINNTQIDDAQYIDVVMPLYNLIEYSDNFQKHREFYFNIVEMNKLQIIIILNLLILLMLILLIRLILK